MTDGGGPPTPAKASAFYGVIQGAVAVRASTQETWAAMRQFAARNNVSLPASMFNDLNAMRKLASGNRNASETLNRAASTAPIDNRMIGTQIFARSPARRAAGDLYRVDFTVTSASGGQVKLDNYHLLYSWSNLPGTVGELKDDIYRYSASLASVYGTDVITAGDFAIGAY